MPSDRFDGIGTKRCTKGQLQSVPTRVVGELLLLVGVLALLGLVPRVTDTSHGLREEDRRSAPVLHVHVYFLTMRSLHKRIRNFTNWWNRSGLPGKVLLSVPARGVDGRTLRDSGLVHRPLRTLTARQTLISYSHWSVWRHFAAEAFTSNSTERHVALIFEDDVWPYNEQWADDLLGILVQLSGYEWDVVQLNTIMFKNNHKLFQCSNAMRDSNTSAKWNIRGDELRILPATRREGRALSELLNDENRTAPVDGSRRICSRRLVPPEWRTWPWGAGAYVVSNAGAGKLIECNMPVTCVVDATITNRGKCCPGLATFTVHPNLFGHGGFVSENRKDTHVIANGTNLVD